MGLLRQLSGVQRSAMSRYSMHLRRPKDSLSKGIRAYTRLEAQKARSFVAPEGTLLATISGLFGEFFEARGLVPHGYELLRRGRMERHHRVEIRLRGPHLHRNAD